MARLVVSAPQVKRGRAGTVDIGRGKTKGKAHAAKQEPSQCKEKGRQRPSQRQAFDFSLQSSLS